MFRPSRTTAILILTLLLLSIALLAQPNRISGRVDDARWVNIQGSVHPKAQPQYDQGPVDRSLRLGYITLMLTPTAAWLGWLRSSNFGIRAAFLIGGFQAEC